MMADNCGCALVLVFADGRRTAVLSHIHDGGEPYMANVIRRGIKYAQAHYDCGNIVDVLLSEPEMATVKGDVLDFVSKTHVRHVYYVTYRWDQPACRKTYALLATHTGVGSDVAPETIPVFARDIPGSAKSISVR